MNYEEVLDRIGGFGIYQWCLFLSMTMLTVIPGIEFMLTLMATYTPKFTCVPPNNTLEESYNISSDQCRYLANNSWYPCTNFNYDQSAFTNTLVTELTLVCDRAYHATGLQTAAFVGFIWGTLYSYLGDKLGRLKIIFPSMAAHIVFSIAIVVIPGLYWQYGLRFFHGISSCLAYQGFVVISETSPVSWRGFVGGNFFLPWSIGYMLCPVFAMWGRDWRWIKLYSMLTCFCYVMSFFFLVESPRWLLLKGREKQAVKNLKRMARINKVKINDAMFENIECRNEPTGDLKDFIRYKWVLIYLVVLMIISWTMTGAYYGISIDLKFASGNIFFNTFLMGLIELPSGPVTAFVCQKFTRKGSFITFITVTGICMVAAQFMRDQGTFLPWFRVLCALLTKICLIVSWNISLIVRTELIPISLRNSSFLLTDSLQILGIAICPQIVGLNDTVAHYFSAVFFAAQFLIAIPLVHYLLPETKGLTLPDTAAEANQLKKGNELEWNLRKLTSVGNEDPVELEPLNNCPD